MKLRIRVLVLRVTRMLVHESGLRPEVIQFQTRSRRPERIGDFYGKQLCFPFTKLNFLQIIDFVAQLSDFMKYLRLYFRKDTREQVAC